MFRLFQTYPLYLNKTYVIKVENNICLPTPIVPYTHININTHGNCLQTSIVYLATVSTDQNTYKYIGLTENSFKQRFTTHNQSFRHEKYSNATELSKLIWILKKSNTNYKVTWQVLQSAIPYKIGGIRCDLCLSEKLHIINTKDRIINKKTELISKCRHKNKFTLKSLK